MMTTPAPFEKDRPAGICRRGGTVRDQRVVLSHGSRGKVCAISSTMSLSPASTSRCYPLDEQVA